MNKLSRTTTKVSAVFLATVLLAGTIALSAPSFMIGTAQAQSYYGGGGMDRYDDRKSYGMDNYGSSDYGKDNDRKSYGMDNYGSSDYGKDNDRKSYGNDYGYESQYQSYKPDYKPEYSSYGKDDNRDKSKDSSKNVDIKKIKCNNININLNAAGGSGTTTNGNTTNGNGDNGNKTNGFKKIDRDGFTFVCINNNNNVAGGGNVTTPPTPPLPPQEQCEECFGPENEGGQLPPPRVIQLDAYLAANVVPIGNDPDVDNRQELCAAIVAVAGTPQEVTSAQIITLLNAALVPNVPPGQLAQVIECLGDLITIVV